MLKQTCLTFFACLIMTGTAFAAHPLITDDAGTQGKGKWQLELNAQYGRDDNKGIVQHTTPSVCALTYGLTDPIDIALGVPYIYTDTDNSKTSSSNKGFGDLCLSVKWRFFEQDGWSLAVRPGLTFPIGDEDHGLGNGRVTESLFFITTKELKPWAFHANLGYIRNDNSLDQRTDLYHVSVAAQVEVVKDLKLVANTGIQQNTDKHSNTDPAFLLGGVIYSIYENFDVDLGYKYGLTTPEVDHTILAGLTLRF
ncbi:MAG: transporter [Deltaproteobacteria bacterium]|nr:transporter [Deltaproteobacteria bacterium]